MSLQKQSKKVRWVLQMQRSETIKERKGKDSSSRHIKKSIVRKDDEK